MNSSPDSVRIAPFERVSTSDQEDEGYGFELQDQALQTFIDRNSYKGWYTKPEWKFIQQVSGKSENIEERERMLKMAKAGEFDIVLVYDISRISRDLFDLLEVFKQLSEYGVGFVSIRENMDFSGTFGKFCLQILGAIAELEWSKIKERTFDGRLASARAGNYVGSHPSYGYERIPNKEYGKGHKLKLIPAEAKIVRQIYQWYVKDKKELTEIARLLNEANVPKGKASQQRIKGTKWSDNTIRSMLSNEMYRGIYTCNRWRRIGKNSGKYCENPPDQWIVKPVESIVSDSLFYLAQERLQSGNRGARGGGRRDYLLAGKLFDPLTQRGFVGYESMKGTKNYRRKKIPASLSVDGKEHQTISIAEKGIAEFVWSHIKKAINSPEKFLALHRKNNDHGKLKSSLLAEKKVWDSLLAKANSRIELLQSDFYNGNIGEAERNTRKVRFDNDRETALQKIREIEQRIDQIDQYNSACLSVKTFSQKFSRQIKNATYEEKKALVKMLVERIEITDQVRSSTLFRNATVFFRFEPYALSEAMPKVRTVKPHGKGNNRQSKQNFDVSSGGLRKGYYLFSFQSIVFKRRINRG